MIEPRFLDELARKLAGAIPSGLQDFQKDLEKNFRAILTSTFARLDLVTREEFSIQQAVLERTRARLEALESQVATLEVRSGVRKEEEKLQGAQGEKPPETPESPPSTESR